MKTSELSGAQLALWVARACGHVTVCRATPNGVSHWVTKSDSDDTFVGYIGGEHTPQYAPHENWAQGGPLLDTVAAIGFVPLSDAEWLAEDFMTAARGRGGTQLIAAMRAIVTSKFGDTVSDEINLNVLPA